MPPKQKQDEQPPSQQKDEAQKDGVQNSTQQESGADVITTAPESQVADAAGLSTGELRALKQDAGVNQQAGHSANIVTWEKSVQGQEFKDGEKDREKAEKEWAKSYDEQFAKGDVDEAAKTFQETVDKA